MNQESRIKKIWGNISDKIRHIQSEPERVKVRYIWSLAIALFILVVAVWLVFSQISLSSVRVSKGMPESIVRNDIKDKIKNGFGEFKNNVLPELRSLLRDEGKTNETQITTQITPSPS